MSRNLIRFSALLATGFGCTFAHGQTASEGPYDPTCWPVNAGVYSPGPSTDYGTYGYDNGLFACTVGISGTVTWDKSCVGPSGVTNNVKGKFGFGSGTTGSVQSTIDDGLMYTAGMPFTVGQSYGFSQIVTDTQAGGQAGTRTTFGSTISSYYYGASDRYAIIESTDGGVFVNFRMDVIGDAARFQWHLYNTGTATQYIGLWSGSWVTLAGGNPAQPIFTSIGLAYAPGYKAFQTQAIFDPKQGATVPPYADFVLNQTDSYGLQVVNSPSLPFANASDQTPVDEFAIGNENLLFGNSDPFKDPAPPYPYKTLPDIPLQLGATSFLQKWYPSAVAPGLGTTDGRTIVAYYRDTWAISDYSAPFAVVADAPPVITTDPNDPSTFTNGNFTLRVYLDNVRGYDTAYRQLDLSNVRVTLTLPQGMTNANDATNTQTTIVQTVPSVLAGHIGYTDFAVKTSPNIYGKQSYTVTVDAPTYAHKVLTGTINVASQPKLDVRQDANMVSTPWIFQQGDWQTILGLTADQDFQAFDWSADLGQYVVSSGPTRGKGSFVISNAAHGIVSLGGTPKQAASPTGNTSGVTADLAPGWNLIGNPFNYSFDLGQLLGVPGNNNSTPLSFSEMVSQGVINGSLAYYDPTIQDYSYISNVSDQMLPDRGYWIYVANGQRLILYYPTVQQPFVPRSSTKSTWQQNASHWKLQLSARTGQRLDAQNFIGVGTAAETKSLSAVKPPIEPVKNALSLSINDTQNGKPIKLAQSLRSGGSQQTWNVDVFSKTAGSVTVTWPNLATVPGNVQFRMTDTSTGATRDLRRTSGYTFTSAEQSTRSFRIDAYVGSGSKAIIGNVTVSRVSRSASSPLSISYALASDATTSVSILSNGREIYAATRARSDRSGQNSVVWNLRDAANRAVAPGTYQVQIIAEDSTGARVRRVVPVTITR